MTKRELIEILEPFDDDIQIIQIQEGYAFESYAYYTTFYGIEGKIIINRIPDIALKNTVKLLK